METTFQICIQNLESEISSRDRGNAILREEILLVRSDLEETKKDITYIREYLGRKKPTGSQNKPENIQLPVGMEDKPLRKNRSGKMFKATLTRVK